MYQNYPIIGIGSIIGDFYYQNNDRISKVSGGGSVWNSLVFCKTFGNTCYAVGIAGKDSLGKICIESLAKVDIDVENIMYSERETDRVYIKINPDGSTKSSIYCPICGNSNYNRHRHIKIDCNKIKEMGSGIIIADSLNINIFYNQKFNNNFKFCLSIINIEQLNLLYNSNKIFDFSKIDIVFTTKKVLENIGTNNKDIGFFTAKNIIIFDSNTLQISERNEFHKVDIKIPSIIKDKTGKYDIIFAAIIDTLANRIKNDIDYLVDKDFLQDTAKLVNEFIPDVLNTYGARGLIEEVKPIKFNNCSFCGIANTIKNRSKNIITNIDSLLDKIYDAQDTVAYEEIKSIIDNLKNNAMCVGTGGSYTVASYAARVINKITGNIALCCHPVDVFHFNLSNIGVCFLFSYSGTTKDILEVIKYLKTKNIKCILISKIDVNNNLSDELKLVDKIISYGSDNTYDLWEKGFISIAGTVCPCSLFARISVNESTEEWKNRIFSIWKYWQSELRKEKYTIYIKNIKNNIVDLFYSLDTLSVVEDIESKFIESGYGRISRHEKKDFSHGRFNILKYIEPKYIIYLTNKNSIYNKILLEYFSKTENINIIKLDAPEYENDILGEFSLLIASQILFNKISDIVKRDLAKPEYPDSAIQLYRYDKGLNNN